jgi:hypothetical protein
MLDLLMSVWLLDWLLEGKIAVACRKLERVLRGESWSAGSSGLAARLWTACWKSKRGSRGECWSLVSPAECWVTRLLASKLECRRTCGESERQRACLKLEWSFRALGAARFTVLLAAACKGTIIGGPAGDGIAP